jgi:hypothetical protein
VEKIILDNEKQVLAKNEKNTRSLRIDCQFNDEIKQP